MDLNREKFGDLLKKIEDLRKSGNFDLSTEEDLSIAVMNLISLEEHFYFTGEKTGKESYFDLLNETREIRKNLLARMIDKKEGETWCISKHLLATSMRLIEVGTKLQTEGKKDEAKKLFDYAYKLYSMFWGLRLKLIDTPEIKKEAVNEKSSGEAQDKPWTLEEVVDKLVDCCDE